MGIRYRTISALLGDAAFGPGNYHANIDEYGKRSMPGTAPSSAYADMAAAPALISRMDEAKGRHMVAARLVLLVFGPHWPATKGPNHRVRSSGSAFRRRRGLSALIAIVNAAVAR
jgi:hypothetical protein